jgi:UDP-N-acetyl-D-mannosaminuronic acid dehydrogenase
MEMAGRQAELLKYLRIRMLMSKDFKSVAMIGLGYIGLPTAALFASRKINVIGVDVNQSVVDIINSGKIHIIEPELDQIVEGAVKHGFLRAVTTPEPADAFLIAVPTPFVGDHEPDLSFVKAAAKSIATVIKRGDLVILESTSPVGTTENMAAWLAIERPDLTFPQQVGENADVNIAYCPERVLPGGVVKELVVNDRIIGGMTVRCSLRAVSLYKIFVEGQCIQTNPRMAEMCKLTENSFRDVNIAFANELSLICDKLSINVWELIELANLHPRVGILQPGPGVGGHCIAVDPWFIVNAAPNEARLIRVAREVNDSKPQYLINKIEGLIKKGLSKVVFFGMTYKPNIDDFRESPAIEIINSIAKNLGTIPIKIVEPYAKNLDMLDLEVRNVALCSIEDALSQSDILVLLVDHDEFKAIPIDLLAGKIVIDAKGCWGIDEK